MIHGSSRSVSDKLTLSIDAIQAIDRPSRMDVKCKMRAYQIEFGSLNNQVPTIDKFTDPTSTILSSRRIIGVGSVGQIEEKASYTLDRPVSTKLEFKTVLYGAKKALVKDI